MNVNKQDREYIVTLSAAKGLSMGSEMLRGVYPERNEGLSMTLPVLVVKVHHRGASLRLEIAARNVLPTELALLALRAQARRIGERESFYDTGSN